MKTKILFGVLIMIVLLASCTAIVLAKHSEDLTGLSATNNMLAEKGIKNSDLNKPKIERDNDLEFIFYNQQYQGLPVYNGKVGFILKNGKIVYENNNYYRNININTKPGISLNEANNFASEIVDDDIIDSNLVIFPKNGHYYLAYEVIYPEKTVFVDAQKSRILEERSNIIYDDIHGTVTGNITPEKPTDAKITVPFANQYVSLNDGTSPMPVAATDANGNYTFTVSGNYNVTAALSGPYVIVVNDQAAETNFSANVTSPAEKSWNWANYDTSYYGEESNVFYYINKIHNYFTKGTPFDISAMNYQMTATVNIDMDPCNAWYNTYSDNIFFVNSTSCGNHTSLWSDVIYHEYTHGVIDHIYDLGTGCSSEGGAMHEGFADYFAGTNNNNQCMAEGWGGAACLRNLTNTLRWTANSTGECHNDGKIFGGAMWDLRQSTNATFTDALMMNGIKAQTQSFASFLAAILAIDGGAHNTTICTAFTTNHGIGSASDVHINAPSAGSILTKNENVSVTGTASNPLCGSATFVNYTVEYTTVGGTNWTLIGSGTSPAYDSTLAVLNTANLTRGNYWLKLTERDSSNTTNVTFAFTISDAAVYCTTSPCQANSSLIKSRDSIGPESEPNQPNTIDGCADGTDQLSGYLSDESLENITVTSSGTNFTGGTQVHIDVWAFCWDGGDIDNINIIYANSTSDLKNVPWKVISSVYCSGPGFELFETNLTLDAVGGNHSIRALIQLYGSTTSTCSTSSFDDPDDVVFNVPDTFAPAITSVSSGSITTSSAQLTWTTNELANSTIKYGTVSTTLGSSVANNTFSTAHSTTLSSLSSSSLYYYNISSCDALGNCGESGPYNFTTSTETSNNNSNNQRSSGGGGGASALFTFNLTSTQSEVAGLEIGGGFIAYNANNETHTVKLSGIIFDSAEFTIASNPIKVLLKVGETKQIDANGNGQKDLSITLMSMTSNSAIVSLKLIKEVIAEESSAESKAATGNQSAEAAAGPANTTAGNPTVSKQGITLLAILAVAAIITFAAVNKLLKKKRYTGK